MSSQHEQDTKIQEEKKYDYDVVVIGGGSGGLAHAKRAKHLNPKLKVAVFDFVTPSKRGTSWKLGGTCVNVGCIPKKLMHHVGQTLGSFHTLSEYGIDFDTDVDASFRWERMIGSINNYIRSLNWSYKKQLVSLGVEYINAYATFVDEHTVKYVEKNREMTVTSNYFVVATGGRPNYGDYPGVELCLTSDDLFWLKKHPGKNILVVGGGYIALECASFLNDMGCDVTVMYRSKLLKEFDEQCVEQIAELMERRGVRFVRDEPIGFSRTEGEIDTICVSTKSTKNSLNNSSYNNVILAIGRVPCTDTLGLDKLNVKMSKKKIVVDSYDRSTVSNIHAIGDVATHVTEHNIVPGSSAYSTRLKKICKIESVYNDGVSVDQYTVSTLDGTVVHNLAYNELMVGTKNLPELTPVAIKVGTLLADRLFNDKSKDSDPKTLSKWIPTTVFTTPEYACVGLTEDEADEMYGADNVEVWMSRFGSIESLMLHPTFRNIKSEMFTGRHLWARRNALAKNVYWDETCFNTQDYSTVYLDDDRSTMWRVESINKDELMCIVERISDNPDSKVDAKRSVNLSQLTPAGETAEYEYQRYVKSDHLCKIITTKHDGKVLGVHFVGKNAGEVIQGFALACASNPNLTKSHFDDMIAIHPIVAEEFLVLDVNRSSNKNFLKSEGCGGGSC